MKYRFYKSLLFICLSAIIIFTFTSCKFINKLAGNDGTYNEGLFNNNYSINESSPVFETYERVGNKFYFGRYPQTKVEATKKNKLKSIKFDSTWISYNYYLPYVENDEFKSFQTDYMFYKDVDTNKDGIYDYRGVYFTEYRYDYCLSSYNYHQEDNGYLKNNIYWFSYDLIEWDILEETNSNLLINSNLILDSQEFYPSNSTSIFYHNGGYGYANNYELSNIRSFINNNFYNSAFNFIQKSYIKTTEVDNSLESTGYDELAELECNNTFDKMFLLSNKEAKEYYTYDEFPKDGTDYAICQGLFLKENKDRLLKSSWWLRSPSKFIVLSVINGAINPNKYLDQISVDFITGVSPACWINII